MCHPSSLSKILYCTLNLKKNNNCALSYMRQFSVNSDHPKSVDQLRLSVTFQLHSRLQIRANVMQCIPALKIKLKVLAITTFQTKNKNPKSSSLKIKMKVEVLTPTIEFGCIVVSFSTSGRKSTALSTQYSYNNNSYCELNQK